MKQTSHLPSNSSFSPSFSSPFKSPQQPLNMTVDLVVLGGGAVATTALLQAQQLGFSAVQALPRPRHQPAGLGTSAAASAPVSQAVPRCFAISPATQAGLAQLGVWGLLSPAQVQRCEQMRVFWQGDTPSAALNPPAALHLSAHEAALAQLCSFVSEADLGHALQQALSLRGRSHPAIEYDGDDPAQAPRCQAAPLSASHRGEQGVTVLVGGRTLRASLCLIAQGADSPTAAQLGFAPTVFDYQHRAVVAVLGCDAGQPLAHDTAWQWLGGAAQGHDVLALLPMPAPAQHSSGQGSQARHFGLVWSQPAAQALAWQGQDAALLAAVQARAGAAFAAAGLGALHLHSAVQQFALFASTAPAFADAGLAPCVVLLGDTAHKIHPLAGQGLNLGFEDVFTLFDLLAQREPWRGLGDARLLARFQRQRSAQAQPIAAVVHSIARRAAWPAPLHVTAHWALRAQASAPALAAALRRALVRAATRGV